MLLKLSGVSAVQSIADICFLLQFIEGKKHALRASQFFLLFNLTKWTYLIKNK